MSLQTHQFEPNLQLTNSHMLPMTVLSHDHQDTIDLLRINCRMYKQLQRADMRLNLQIQSIQRMLTGIRADGTTQKGFVINPETVESNRIIAETLTNPIQSPLVAARNAILPRIAVYEKEIKKLSQSLPAFPWVKSVRGFGPVNFGLIVGECGDLSNYANPAKLWKRMGLGLHEGSIQRCVSTRGKKGKEAKQAQETAIAMAYSPARRAIMHIIGECLVKQNDGIYRDLYDQRKVYETERLKDEKTVKIHSHKRAMRYMEKRLLSDLWVEWNR